MESWASCNSRTSFEKSNIIKIEFIYNHWKVFEEYNTLCYTKETRIYKRNYIANKMSKYKLPK